MMSFKQSLQELKRKGFLEVSNTSSEDAKQYFGDALSDLGYDIEKEFPNFERNYTLIKGKISFGILKRKDMPVVQSVNLDRFKKWMVLTHKVKTVKTKVKPVNLYPLQKQLYIDKPLQNIKKHGLKSTLDFIRKTSHSLISLDSRIMDGNHRWLLAALHDPNIQIHAYLVRMAHDELIKEMNHFTDKVIKKARNESVVLA